MKREIEVTNDGSHTLFVPELNEHYHSTNGAIDEARHVFINSALAHCAKKNINVLEIGFGTGLNALLTMIEADIKELSINYTSLELFPVDMSDVELLNFAELIDNATHELFIDLHYAHWNKSQAITPNFMLHKMNTDFRKVESTIFDDKFDVVYFDAFGPDKQPDMWQPDLFEKLYASMNDGGIITTYSAKGSIRRMMQSIGFMVERLPGPIGKREMLRGVK